MRKYRATERGRESNLTNNRKWRVKLKIAVLTHYGNGNLACVKCGFNDIRALSLDHINGRQKGESPARTYRNWYLDLQKENYPKGYQTLCMNCQWIKRSENKEL